MTDATRDDTPAEPSFTYRRRYAFTALALNSAGVGAIIWKLDDPTALKWIALALVASNLVVAGLYMAGASMSDWALLTKAWRKPDAS